ncbi:MAG: hypothetical protein LBB21_03375 [Holosporaceae bacterium]|jgi:endonuclease IV|nr:hypothetical protein [Holosporaceae bacterium]
MQDIRTVIHAPFYDIDTGNRDLPESNLRKLKDAQKFADLLCSDIIVLHPGSGDGVAILLFRFTRIFFAKKVGSLGNYA